MKRNVWIRLALASMVLALAVSFAWAVPGLNPGGWVPQPNRDRSISAVFSVTGSYTLSVDGNGTLNNDGVVQVQKPAGATVYRAFLFAATTGFTGCPIPNGAVEVGTVPTPVVWDMTYNNLGLFDNGWSDITAIVLQQINLAAPGLVNIAVREPDANCIDGEGIAVIFNDPSADPNSTIILLFGGQALAGDDFQINLGAPIDINQPGLHMNMGLGISYSYSGGGQASEVDVNGSRISSSAGGLDDGDAIANGALFTVGGIGDDATTNPANAFQGPSADERYDDEAYNLLAGGFIPDGSSSILVHTVNPSNDDNILFAWLDLGVPAALGESVILTPVFDSNPTGQMHTLTATVRDDNGNPIQGRNVSFDVLTGPNAGLHIGNALTNALGVAQVSYTSALAGIDRIQACYLRDTGELECSNIVVKVWYEDVDMGDLLPCNYPTLVNNPGHGLSGIAWLGGCVSGEPAPWPVNTDPCDNGVALLGLPWMPCTVYQVQVLVTAGPWYGMYAEMGGQLFLNAWKDGNLDYDFCDELPCGPMLASEWIIQDVPVGPGPHNFSIIDPGVFYLGTYDGVFRFRLTSRPVGRFGFGLVDNRACPNMQCGTYAFDFLGEVEDYFIEDAQLAVNLTSFTATAGDRSVSLNWATASETRNDHFEIMRDGLAISQVGTQGNDAQGHTYSFADRDLTNGTTYSYTLVAVDVNGVREELRTVNATPSASAATITSYALHQNYPNPFNPTTNISFDLVENGFVTLKVYNLMAQQVAEVLSGSLNAGSHTVTFDASSLSSGVYLYRLEVNGFAAEQKMLLMK